MSTTKIHSTSRIANIGPDDAMILAHAANPDGSNFRKGHVQQLHCPMPEEVRPQYENAVKFLLCGD
jgi:hypothetical protein